MQHSVKTTKVRVRTDAGLARREGARPSSTLSAHICHRRDGWGSGPRACRRLALERTLRASSDRVILVFPPSGCVRALVCVLCVVCHASAVERS